MLSIGLALVLMLGGGCTKQVIHVERPPDEPLTPPVAPESTAADTPATVTMTPLPEGEPAAPILSARQVAARNLAREGQISLGRGDVAAAIDTLEHSLKLDARNGEAYFYLADAWRRQGNLRQARQFHRMARTYLENDGAWDAKLQRQAAQLDL